MLRFPHKMMWAQERKRQVDKRQICQDPRKDSQVTSKNKMNHLESTKWYKYPVISPTASQENPTSEQWLIFNYRSDPQRIHPVEMVSKHFLLRLRPALVYFLLMLILKGQKQLKAEELGKKKKQKEEGRNSALILLQISALKQTWSVGKEIFIIDLVLVVD